MRNALTIDLEDWYHPELVRRHLPSAERDAQIVHPASDGIEQSTRPLLDMLHKRGVKATFFIVGELVRRHPGLIEAIASHGNELACHGMSHKPLWQMTSDGFRTELEEFSDAMDVAVPGVELLGFRAPTFSLDNRTRWALGVLAEFGYHYDSSIFPVKTPLYGVSGCPLTPYRPSADDVTAEDKGGALVEFPMSVWTPFVPRKTGWAGLRVPVCGGVYLRVLPFRFVRSCLRQINKQRPFAIYVHPWETYTGTPRAALPVLSRFATYHNVGTMMYRLTTLLDEFEFAPMKAVLEEMGELRR